MGIFEGLDAEKYDRTYSNKMLLERILHYFKPQQKRMLVVLLMVLIMAGAGALQPIIVSRGVDELKAVDSGSRIFLIPLAVLLIGLISWVANWVSQRQSSQAIAGVVVDLASDAFEAATDHDLSFYDEYSTGRIVSRITTDTQDFGQLVTIVTDVISQVVEALVLGIVLVNMDWKLSLVLFAVIPLVFVMSIAYRKLARKVTVAGMRAMANVNATIKETVSGIAIAKNFRQESEIYRQFSESNQTSYKVNIQRGLVLSIVFPVLNTLAGLMTALMVYLGGLSASQGLVTAGTWYLFILSLDRFLFPVMNISAFWTQIQNGLSAAERVFALIDAETIVQQTGDLPVGTMRGEIDFEHVCFAYKTGEVVLDDFCLYIHPGENLAIVGHTGAGKSSLAKLIARFYEFQAGTIRMDGQDIREVNLKEYRKQLGIVSQTPFLFSGTVLENIRYGNVNSSLDEINQLVDQIGQGEWLETLPEGLQTQVGERGSLLSMGQRQLVALMRVLVQKPAVFILDEATASVDPFTERQIQQALNLILASTTSILIAHRLSTVKSADRIIVLDHGKILEEGDHAGLLKRGGQYAVLYNTYFRHQSLAYVEQSRPPAKTELTSAGRISA